MYRVVLVDDEHMIIEGLSRVVPWEKLGCEVSGTASNGREGLELIRRVQPHILMTDIRMPNMDGLTMVAALRSELPNLQITVLTAFRDFEYAQTALNLGVCRYLLKPSKMDELNEAIHTMIARLDALPKQQAPETAEPTNPAGNYIVRQALDYMKAHCAERLSLGDVADQVYVSQWHLSKLINRHTNQSFLDILGGMRVEKARQLLAGSTLRIHEVAEQCGYSDLGHFSRSFKKLTGLTPGEYRDTAGRSEG
jgi:two-component system response regulator YesN